MKNKDYIYLIHKYAYDHMGEEIKTSELHRYLKSNGINLKDNNINTHVELTVLEAFSQYGNHLDYKLLMKNSAYYRYLDYLELLEARNNARSSRNLALVSVAIASTLALIQIIIGLITIFRR